MMIRAEIHRPNLGSLAYVWVGDREFVATSTSQAHAILNRRGDVEHVETIMAGGGMVERYTITKGEA